MRGSFDSSCSGGRSTMAGRRKRMKTAASGSRNPRQVPGIEVGPPETPMLRSENEQGDFRFPVDSSEFERGSFASRCSVRLINEVVSKFDDKKRDLVKSIGFGGILHFPAIKQFNRKFTLWLMTSVNEMTSTLTIGRRISIRFNKNDVASVIGIPSSGLSVLGARLHIRECRDKVLQDFLGDEFREHRSIKYVQEIIQRGYSSPMSKQDADRFKIAFVVFVVSNLLCPSAKHDYASVDYWTAIQDPDSICRYDWAQYVIVRLLDAVKKLKEDLAGNIRFPNITGCSIFLQVLYLDSLDLDGLSVAHNTFPRVREFSFEKIRAMILADSNYARHNIGDDDLPIVQLRDPSGCIYSWALGVCLEPEDSRSGSLLAIWEAAVAMVHLLKIPSEAAGPLFVAVADFQDQINSGLLLTGTLGIKLMSFLVSIMTPYSRGFSYNPYYAGESPTQGIDALGSSISNGITRLSGSIRFKPKNSNSTEVGQSNNMLGEAGSSMRLNGSCQTEASTSSEVHTIFEETIVSDPVQRSYKGSLLTLDEMPHHLNVSLRVATTMSQFYSLIRKPKAGKGFDLNQDSSDNPSSSNCSSYSGSECDVLPSPWELGYSWSTDDARAISEFDKFRPGEDDECLAIVHSHPRYIQVSAHALHSQFSGKCEIELDMFDALIRVVRQEDDKLYAAFGSFRWRHFFESDFMESILSGMFELTDSNIHDNILHALSNADLSRCKLVSIQ